MAIWLVCRPYPLDAHPEIGHNREIAHLLELEERAFALYMANYRSEGEVQAASSRSEAVTL